MPTVLKGSHLLYSTNVSNIYTIKCQVTDFY